MLRDVANPSADDTYFPTFRYFSWYLGHSYSHGATSMADGKDEESTSEDVNFWYGMMLWGKATENKAVEDLGSLMLRLNAHAVRTYFLLTSDNTIHPPKFIPHHVTGIFFDNKVDYSTWFSAEKHCIHGIQMVPVSPINGLVRTATFVQQEWDDILSKEAIVTSGNTTNPWFSVLLVNLAVINQADALAKLAETTMEDGLTRSWALYNAASRGSTGSAQRVTKVVPNVAMDTPVAPRATPSVVTAPSITTTGTPTATTETPAPTAPAPISKTLSPEVTATSPISQKEIVTDTAVPPPELRQPVRYPVLVPQLSQMWLRKHQ